MRDGLGRFACDTLDGLGLRHGLELGGTVGISGFGSLCGLDGLGHWEPPRFGKFRKVLMFKLHHTISIYIVNYVVAQPTQRNFAEITTILLTLNLQSCCEKRK